MTKRKPKAHNISRLRVEACDAIDVLISFLDRTDPYASTELEQDIGADLESGNDDEDSLGFLNSVNQTNQCQGLGFEREDEHDGAEPDVDDEPTLGWTTTGQCGGYTDWEKAPSTLNEAAHAHYRKNGSYDVTNNDGMHVDIDSGFHAPRHRLRNLSAVQRDLMRSRGKNC